MAIKSTALKVTVVKINPKTIEENMVEFSRVSRIMEGKIEKALKKDRQRNMFVYYSAYNCDENDNPIDNLHKIAARGKIILRAGRDEFYGGKGSKAYESPILENPTWLQIAVCANRMIRVTRDYHHRFLESIRRTKKKVRGATIFEFSMGS